LAALLNGLTFVTENMPPTFRVAGQFLLLISKTVALYLAAHDSALQHHMPPSR